MTACACCLSALQSRFVSRFGRARADDRFAVFSSTLRDGRRRLLAQPSRDDDARVVRDCCMWGTLLPAWTFTSGIESPAFTMAASERERFAAGGSVFAATRGSWRTSKRAQGRCGKLNESVGPPRSVSVEACPPAVRGTPHITTMRERFATVRHTRVSHTRHT